MPILYKKDISKASRIDRLLANIIDSLIALPSAIIAMIFVAITNNFELAKFIVYLLFFISLAMQAYLLTTLGQTIGKRLMKIKIGKKNTKINGGFVTNVLLRYGVGFILLGFIPLYSFIDVLFIFREDRRCIHDIIAGTDVIDA